MITVGCKKWKEIREIDIKYKLCIKVVNELDFREYVGDNIVSILLFMGIFSFLYERTIYNKLHKLSTKVVYKTHTNKICKLFITNTCYVSLVHFFIFFYFRKKMQGQPKITVMYRIPKEQFFSSLNCIEKLFFKFF